MVHPVDATEAAVASMGVPEPLPFAASELAAFCARLGHDFRDPSLLVQALTHRSWCAEHAGFASNERLEFLGDAVLGLVVTDEIYTRLPDAEEGQLSRVRAAVVCAPATNGTSITANAHSASVKLVAHSANQRERKGPAPSCCAQSSR